MAIVEGLKIRGTIDDLTFYKLNGKYFVRKKANIDRSKMKKHPKYELLRQYNQLFGKSRKMSAYLYSLLSKEERKYGVINKIHVWVLKRLKENMNEDQIYQLIIDLYTPPALPIEGSLTPEKANE